MYANQPMITSTLPRTMELIPHTPFTLSPTLSSLDMHLRDDLPNPPRSLSMQPLTAPRPLLPVCRNPRA
jgi:hypothetical protein